MSERIKGVVEYLAAYALLKFFGWMPRNAASAGAEAIASIGFHIARRQRQAGLRNLQMAMPHLDDNERDRILRGCFSNLGRLLVEFSHFHQLNASNISSLVTYEGFENYDKAVRCGKGVIFLTGHFGAWELSSFAHSIYGHPMKFVVREIDNHRVDRLISTYRQLGGNIPIEKKHASRDILRALRANETVGILF